MFVTIVARIEGGGESIITPLIIDCIIEVLLEYQFATLNDKGLGAVFIPSCISISTLEGVRTVTNAAEQAIVYLIMIIENANLPPPIFPIGRRPQNASFANSETIFANSESQTESSAKTIKNEHGVFLLSINNKNRVSPALLFADNKF